MTFDEIYQQVQPYTLLTPAKLKALVYWSREAAKLPGDMAELGVYRGGSTMALHMANPGKLIHAFDTFKGIPNADPSIDLHQNGEFSEGVEVIHRLNRFDKILPWEGSFPHTADRMLPTEFCFAHFDGDTYQSCKDFINFFWPRLVVGGMMLFDDWNWSQCPGVDRAIREFTSGLIVNGKEFSAGPATDFQYLITKL